MSNKNQILQERVQALKQRAAPIQYSFVSINDKGEIETPADLLDQGIIQGYLFVWGHRNYHGEKMVKGCCAKSIRDRGPKSDAKYKLTFLWQHDPKDPLSLFDELVEDDYGLRFRTKPLDDVPNAQRTIKQIKSGTLNQFSGGFGYVWDKIEYDESDDSLILLEINLMEGSVVTMGSDDETYAIRSVGNPTELIEDVEDFIKSLPRKDQLEARNLFARYKSLQDSESLEQRKIALRDKGEPVATVLDKYKYLTEKL